MTMNLLVYNTYYDSRSLSFFGLRGVDEHHSMKFGDVKLSIVENRECLTFTEHGTKTRNGPSRAEPPRAFGFGGLFVQCEFSSYFVKKDRKISTKTMIQRDCHNENKTLCYHPKYENNKNINKIHQFK